MYKKLSKKLKKISQKAGLELLLVLLTFLYLVGRTPYLALKTLKIVLIFLLNLCALIILSFISVGILLSILGYKGVMIIGISILKQLRLVSTCVFGIIWKVKLPLTTTIALALVIYIIFIASGLPHPKKLSDFPLPQETIIYDKNGARLYSTFDDVQPRIVNLDEVPKTFVEALLLAEDKRFYSHGGFDYIAEFHALVDYVIQRNVPERLTISQKIAHSITPAYTNPLAAFIAHVIVTAEIEQNFSKKQILSVYISTANYGNSAIGVQQAANKYFGKQLKDLSTAESVFLACLPENTYNDNTHTILKTKEKMQIVLNRLLAEGKINTNEATEASPALLAFHQPITYKKAPLISDYILSMLIKKYGEDNTVRKGLTVRSSISLVTQTQLQQIVLEEIMRTSSANTISLMIADTRNGDILGYVNSDTYSDIATENQVLQKITDRYSEQTHSPLNPIISITNREGKLIYQKKVNSNKAEVANEIQGKMVRKDKIFSTYNAGLLIALHVSNDLEQSNQTRNEYIANDIITAVRNKIVSKLSLSQLDLTSNTSFVYKDNN